MEDLTPKVEDREKIVGDLKKKHPGMRLFGGDVPYHGFFVIRAQTMEDMKAGAAEVKKFIETRVAELGGVTKIDANDEEERAKIYRQIDLDSNDLSNDIILSRCVVYPETFSDDLRAGRVPTGIYPNLLDCIAEVSGWNNMEVTEL